MTRGSKRKSNKKTEPVVPPQPTILSEFNNVSTFSLGACLKSLCWLSGTLLIMQLRGMLQLTFMSAIIGWNNVPFVFDFPVPDNVQEYITMLESQGRAYAGSPDRVGISSTMLDNMLLGVITDGVLPMSFEIGNGVSEDEITAILNTTFNLDLYGSNLEQLGGDQQAAFDSTVDQVAYIIATASHESDRFNTLREYGGAAYLSYLDGRLGNCVYDVCGDNQFGEPDYVTYAGTGLVQVTGKANFRKVGEILTPDDPDYFVNNPKDLEKPEIAAIALVRGMMEGWYTGMTLRDYISSNTDFYNARRVVNGTDDAEQIANYARGFREMVEKRYSTHLGL